MIPASRSGWRGISPKWLIGLWILLGTLTAVAYAALPVYMESLESRIVFRAPDCMDTAREQIRANPVDVSERGDSLRVWMTDCLQERQQKMVRHADVVGYGTTGALLVMAIVLTALTGQAVFSRLDHLRARTD